MTIGWQWMLECSDEFQQQGIAIIGAPHQLKLERHIEFGYLAQHNFVLMISRKGFRYDSEAQSGSDQSQQGSAIGRSRGTFGRLDTGLREFPHQRIVVRWRSIAWKSQKRLPGEISQARVATGRE